jgi:hypothetical protein
MDATQLKAYRDKLRATENNIAIRLYCDNGIIIDEGTMFVKWDDANNVILAIKSNEDQQNHPGVKMKIIVTDFDMVQYMIAYSTHKSIQPIAKAFGFTDDQIKNFINKFDDQDLRTYLNAVPEDVMQEIAARQAAIDAQAKVVLQQQEDRAKAEHRVTAQQIRERQQ